MAKITSNGAVRIKGNNGSGSSVVYLSGTTGGATVTLGYYDDYGTFIPLTDGVLLIDTQVTVDQGSDDVMIYALIAGATGTTALSLLVNGLS